MSILSDLFAKRITFQQAAAEAGAWASALVTHNPALAADAGAALAVVKQAASDAITAADTMVGQAAAPATVAVETALEAALASLTHGGSVVLNPFVNDGVDALAKAVKDAADAWALKAKAALATPAA